MRPARTKRRAAEDLRRAVARLPERTKRGMLESVRRDPVIVGAYTGPGGGVCPMLGAHRRGGRTDMSVFAERWDAYTKAGAGRSRPATERELRALEAMLVASLDDPPDTELGRAVEEIKAVRRAAAERAAFAQGLMPRARPASGERDRTEELEGRPGWAWLRPVRRLDEFEAALERASAPAPRDASYSVSPRRTNWISGTMQAGEVLSR